MSSGFVAAAASANAPVAEKDLAQPMSTRRLPSSVLGSSWSDERVGEKGAVSTLQHVETANTIVTTFDGRAGTGNLYNEKGELILLPAPTLDPRDPMNIPFWKKFIGLSCVCWMGALAASAEIILGAMLPVFALEYAGLNPKILVELTKNRSIPPGTDPLIYLSKFPNAPPLWHTYLLGSLPLFVIGFSNLVLVPLAISVGRRPVVIGAGITAVVGAIWAGFSGSLGSHIGARCLQAVGAGTVESLIPFIIQDMCHYHNRNTAISAIFATQGAIIIGLGISAPHLIYYLNWRWAYYITAIGCGVFILGVFFFMPETRYYRTKDEMNGIRRPNEEERVYLPRTWIYDLLLMHGGFEWRKGWVAFLDSLRTFFYPQIFFITLLNSAMIGAAFAAAFTTTPVLIGAPYYWPFLNLGLCLIPVLVAAACVAFITGNMADYVANWFAKQRGTRQPENQLINMILPGITGMVGSILYGLAGEDPFKYPWPVFLLSLGLMSFGFLGTSTVGAVYVLECYPQLAGPALVNIASFRFMVAFALSFKISEWILHFGYLNSMAIYTAIIGFFLLCLPIVFIFGPSWRKRWPGPNRW